MTPRGIKPIRRATAVHLELRDDAELAAMPDDHARDSIGLLTIEESLQLLADALALPSERSEP